MLRWCFRCCPNQSSFVTSRKKRKGAYSAVLLSKYSVYFQRWVDGGCCVIAASTRRWLKAEVCYCYACLPLPSNFPSLAFQCHIPYSMADLKASSASCTGLRRCGQDLQLSGRLLRCLLLLAVLFGPKEASILAVSRPRCAVLGGRESKQYFA